MQIHVSIGHDDRGGFNWMSDSIAAIMIRNMTINRTPKRILFTQIERINEIIILSIRNDNANHYLPLSFQVQIMKFSIS
jgi:hypothetical protein